MPYQKCKIYNDGSHFIAIPHTTRPAVPKRYHPEEVIEVIDDMPQYFISDIMDDDVACTIGQEDKKLLLFDNFNCWDEGCLVGQVSKEVIDQMPKAN